jgi:hypothetical protein
MLPVGDAMTHPLHIKNNRQKIIPLDISLVIELSPHKKRGLGG